MPVSRLLDPLTVITLLQSSRNPSVFYVYAKTANKNREIGSVVESGHKWHAWDGYGDDAGRYHSLPEAIEAVRLSTGDEMNAAL